MDAVDIILRVQAVPLGRPLRLNQTVASFPRAQRNRVHAREIRNRSDGIEVPGRLVIVRV